MGCAPSSGGGKGALFDCSEQDLTELPNIPSGTQELNCSSNKLTALPATIGDLQGLVSLEAHTNQLTGLPPEIANCAALEKLLVYANKIKELPAKFPPALSEINLFNNQVKKLPPAIGQLTALEEVNFAANKLMMTTDEMFAKWASVTVLNMYDNNLVRFGSLAPCAGLVELRLSGNNLEEMPKLSKHASLKIIEMHKNRISTIPDDYFDATPALERLSLWGNMLAALPGSICRCSGLLGLQVQENKLTSLPSGVAYPSKLETLFVQGNQLTTLPAEISACSNLKRVNVSQMVLDSDGMEVADGIKETCCQKADGLFWAVDGMQFKGK